MDSNTLFSLSNPIAMVGWLVLICAPLAPRAAQIVSGIIIPAILSLAYTVLILLHWAGAEGGFSNLTDVMRLFDSPMMALAGWFHFLAFDLFIGAWIVRTAQRENIAHILVLPCLLLAFLFGPAGLVLFLAIRTARAITNPKLIED